MLYGNRDFVAAHPVATKRFVRAVLKATDICATEPELAAQQLVDADSRERYDYALQTLTELPYDALARVRPGGLAAVLRAAAARGGMIKSSPNALIAEGTDWRFLNELKRELKA